MRKLRRIHLVNLGWHQAAFDAETIDFRDEDGKPSNGVLHAENGTGKTTVTGFVFNTIVPSLNKFLPRMIKGTYRFDQYFGTGPAHIVIEWHADDGRHPVTIQTVFPRERNGEPEPERHFTSFRSGMGLSFDTLPLKKLNTQVPPLKNRDDFMHWIADTKGSYADDHDFRTTRDQAEWRHTLDELGLDAPLMEVQLDFNKKEGGIDEFLKSIVDEKSFVSELMQLCLVTSENSRGVLEQVQAGLERLQGYADNQDSLDFLKVLEDKVGSFERVASVYRDDVKASEETTKTARRTKAALHFGIAATEKSVSEIVEKISETGKKLDEVESRIVKTDWLLAAIASVQADHEERDLSAALDTNKTLLGTQTSNLALMRAALEFRSVETKREALKTLEETLEGAREGLAPVQAIAGAAAGTFLAVIERDKASLSDKKSSIEASLSSHAITIAGIRTKMDEQKQSSRLAIKEHARADSRLENARKALKALIDDKHLLRDESIGYATLRLRRESAEIERSIEECRTRIQALEAGIQTHDENIEKLRGLEANGKAEIRVREGNIATRENARLDIPAMVGWTENLGRGTSFEEASERLKELIERHETSKAKLQLDKEQQKAQSASIDRYGLTAIDEATSLVVAHLQANNIRDAQPSSYWLAQTGASAERIKALAVSDPEAFAGVVVPDAKALERATAISGAGLELVRPVSVLTIAALDNAGSLREDSRYVIVPAGAGAYDPLQAREQASLLSDRIDKLDLDIRAAKTKAEQAQAAAFAIARWASEFTVEKIQAMDDGLQQALKELGAFQDEAAKIVSRRDAERIALGTEKITLASKSTTKSSMDTGLRDIGRWAETYGESIELLEQDVDVALARMGTIETTIQNLEAEEREQQVSVDALKKSKEDVEKANEKLGNLRSKVVIETMPPAVLDEISLEVAEGKFDAAMKTLQAAEREQLGPLESQLDDKREELKAATTALSDNHGNYASHPDIAEVSRSASLHGDIRSEELKVSVSNGKVAVLEKDLGHARRSATALRDALSTQARAAIKGLTDLASEELVTRKDTAETRKRDDEGTVRNIRVNLEDLVKKQERIGQQLEKMADAFDTLDIELDRLETKAVLSEDFDRMLAEVASVRREYTSASSRKSESEGEVRKAYDLYLFRPLKLGTIVVPANETNIRDRILDNDQLDLALDGKIVEAVQQRKATVIHDLSENDKMAQYTKTELMKLLNTAVEIIEKAENMSKLPDYLPRFGGKKVLRKTLKLKEDHEKVTVLFTAVADDFIRSAVASKVLPDDDFALAAHLVERYVNKLTSDGKMGIQLLKTSDQGQIIHMPVDEFRASGGEAMTTAMLLYLVVARLRGDMRVKGAGGVNSSVLLLDNPFGVASHTLFITSQIELAKALDIQLIFTTGIKDWSAVGEFPLVVKLRKSGEDMANRRILISAAREYLSTPRASSLAEATAT